MGKHYKNELDIVLALKLPPKSQTTALPAKPQEDYKYKYKMFFNGLYTN